MTYGSSLTWTLAKAQHIAFELKDFFHEDPFRMIYSKGRQDTHLFNAYIDYSQDLESLRIAWRRIKQDCKEVGEIDTRIRRIPPPNEEYNNEASSLFFREYGLMNILQYDVRAFIDIARTIMDKLAKIIVKLLGLSPVKGPRVSFTNHKEDVPLHHRHIHPAYSDFLQNRTHLY